MDDIVLFKNNLKLTVNLISNTLLYFEVYDKESYNTYFANLSLDSLNQMKTTLTNLKLVFDIFKIFRDINCDDLHITQNSILIQTTQNITYNK